MPDHTTVALGLDDMREVIHKIGDEADFFEIQADHAGNILCGYIRLNGSTVGVVANQPGQQADPSTRRDVVVTKNPFYARQGRC